MPKNNAKRPAGSCCKCRGCIMEGGARVQAGIIGRLHAVVAALWWWWQRSSAGRRRGKKVAVVPGTIKSMLGPSCQACAFPDWRQCGVAPWASRRCPPARLPACPRRRPPRSCTLSTERCGFCAGHSPGCPAAVQTLKKSPVHFKEINRDSCRQPSEAQFHGPIELCQNRAPCQIFDAATASAVVLG